MPVALRGHLATVVPVMLVTLVPLLVVLGLLVLVGCIARTAGYSPWWAFGLLVPLAVFAFVEAGRTRRARRAPAVASTPC